MDTNVLVYALDSGSPRHVESRGWLDSALSGTGPVGLAWLAVVGFVRITTSARIVANPLTVEQAMAQVNDWIAVPTCHILQPTVRHAALLTDLLAGVGTGGNLVNDAHLAALAIEHRAEVITYDTDFARFPGLRWSRPGV